MTPLFIHGAGFTSETFVDQAAAFPKAHFPNLPGHLSPGAPASIAALAEFIEAYAAAHVPDGAVLCGHSMGGAVAIETVLRRRANVRAVVLLGSGARLRVAPAILAELERDFEAAIEQIAQCFFAHSTPERIAWATGFMRRVGAGQTARDFAACNAFDALDRLGELRVPLLALTGEADKMTPPKFAEALAGRVPGAQARILPGAGHFVMVEQPEETNAAIRTFLSNIP